MALNTITLTHGFPFILNDNINMNSTKAGSINATSLVGIIFWLKTIALGTKKS